MSAQLHLTAVRKKPLATVHIINADKDPQRVSTPYGGYCSATTAARNWRDHSNSRNDGLQQPPLQPASALAESAVEHVALASAAASTHISFCYAVTLRSAVTQQNSSYHYLLRAAKCYENVRESHAPLSHEYLTSRDQQFEGSSAARTRCRTLDQCALQQQIPGTACTASPCALNSVRPSPRLTLFTTSTPPTRDDLLSTSAHSLRPSVLPVWQHLHAHSIAQCCAAISHTPSDARNCTPLNLGALYIKCSLQQSPNNSIRRVDFKFDSSAARRLFVQEMNAEADERLYTDVTIKKIKVDSMTVERLRQCAIFEVIIENLDRAFLAVVAN